LSVAFKQRQNSAGILASKEEAMRTAPGYVGAIIGLAALGLGPTAAVPAERLAALPRAGTAAVETGEVRPPLGWVNFCYRHPRDCRPDTAELDQLVLTTQLWRKLLAVNKAVNDEVQPLADQAHWGVSESWDYPDDGRGDCEDYALEKRRRLIAAGFPNRVLLMTVVLDENREGHAVLMVPTNRGDLVLDNKRDAVLPWDSTGYSFIKRESRTGAGWVALGDAVPHTATATFVP
jgi:predicted transglutaminase-like cysteine proteinase